jgi:hypothetical protein
LLCLPPLFTLVPCLAYSSIKKVEATCPSKTLVEFQWLAQHYIQKIELSFILLTNKHHYQTRYICYFVDLPGSCHTWFLLLALCQPIDLECDGEQQYYSATESSQAFCLFIQWTLCHLVW